MGGMVDSFDGKREIEVLLDRANSWRIPKHTVSDYISDDINWFTRTFNKTYKYLKGLDEAPGALPSDQQAALLKYAKKDFASRLELAVAGLVTDRGLVSEITSSEYDRESNWNDQLRERKAELIIQILKSSPFKPISEPLLDHVVTTLDEYGPEIIEWAFTSFPQDDISRKNVLHNHMRGQLGELFVVADPAKFAKKMFAQGWGVTSADRVWEAIGVAYLRGDLTTTSDMVDVLSGASISDQAQFFIQGKKNVLAEFLVRDAIVINADELESRILQSDESISPEDVRSLLDYQKIVKGNISLSQSDSPRCNIEPVEYKAQVRDAIQGRIAFSDEIEVFGYSHVSAERWEKEATVYELGIALVDKRFQLGEGVAEHFYSRENIDRTTAALKSRYNNGFGSVAKVNSADDVIFKGQPQAADAYVGWANFEGEAADVIAALAIKCAQDAHDVLLHANMPEGIRKEMSQRWSERFLQRFVDSFETSTGPRIEHTDKALLAYNSIKNSQLVKAPAKASAERGMSL